MAAQKLELTREQILAYRRRVSSLDVRLPADPDSLRRAAWAGLQDSMPRAALLSIHARVEGSTPSAWDDPTLVQVWGPRFSAYVVAERDATIFTLGRWPDDPGKRQRFTDLADRLDAFLAGRTMTYSEAGHALGMNPNSLRYATTTGRVRIRWEGARQPLIWTVPPPAIEPAEALLELARRYLRIFGPTNAGPFGEWAGIRTPRPARAFEALADSLIPVRTPLGDAWILDADERAFREPDAPPAGVRLLPSGDTYYLLWGRDRELLVPDASRRSLLWTSRVWPGAVLVRGEVVGTWRRSDADVTIEPWLALTEADRDAIVAEAEGLPLPGLAGRMTLHWPE